MRSIERLRDSLHFVSMNLANFSGEEIKEVMELVRSFLYD